MSLEISGSQIVIKNLSLLSYCIKILSNTARNVINKFCLIPKVYIFESELGKVSRLRSFQLEWINKHISALNNC